MNAATLEDPADRAARRHAAALYDDAARWRALNAAWVAYPAPGDWAEDGACREYPTELWTEHGTQQEAITICAGCDVLTECQEYALGQHWLSGVWGGMTAYARRPHLPIRQPAA